MKTVTRAAYGKRIERVVGYLTDHLDDAIDLNRLADEAHFSPFHFHRVYCALMGESVAESLRRMRLHRAAVKLLASRSPIAKLAREAHYSSVPAFNRAFKEAYSVPPAAYRARGTLAAALARQGTVEEHAMRRVEIQQLEAQRVIALRHHGDYQQIGNSFDRLTAWAMGHNLIGPQTRSFGIYYNDPAAVPVQELRADACLSVGGDVVTDGEYRVAHTPGGRCAVCVHVGPYAELEQTYQWLYGVWLPRSDYEPADKPCFEEYLNDWRNLPPAQWRTAICLPLREDPELVRE